MSLFHVNFIGKRNISPIAIFGNHPAYWSADLDQYYAYNGYDGWFQGMMTDGEDMSETTMIDAIKHFASKHYNFLFITQSDFPQDLREGIKILSRYGYSDNLHMSVALTIDTFHVSGVEYTNKWAFINGESILVSQMSLKPFSHQDIYGDNNRGTPYSDGHCGIMINNELYRHPIPHSQVWGNYDKKVMKMLKGM